jgi:hypothetical protein
MTISDSVPDADGQETGSWNGVRERLLIFNTPSGQQIPLAGLASSKVQILDGGFINLHIPNYRHPGRVWVVDQPQPSGRQPQPAGLDLTGQLPFMTGDRGA